MNSPHKFWSPLIGCTMLLIGLWGGWWLGHRHADTPGQKKLDTIFSLIRNEYVDEVDIDSLIELTLPELLRNLDPHSAYIPRDELEKAHSDLESSFFGIGVQFVRLNDTVCVTNIISGGPSERAGLLAGDRILEADGESLVGKEMTDDEVIKRLRGENGTTVSLKVQRRGAKKPLTFDVVRGEIPSTSIDAEYMLSDSIGYVKVGKFARNTYMEFITSLFRLREAGARSFVVDLRGNPGGLLESAILMANEFLGHGDIVVEIRGRNLSENRTFYGDGMGSFQEAGLAVLLDPMSASASEVFAGAIQDNDRGMIIGRRSFGKGLVQHPIELADSSELRLTVQRYYTPSGRCIQKLYVPGQLVDYDNEIYERYERGEVFSADSIPHDEANSFTTVRGRKVYGGGGITPDVFVPADTSGVTQYYINLVNANLLKSYAMEYVDLNRESLRDMTFDEVMNALPSNGVLLNSFLNYAASHGVPTRPYYVNISRNLIVNQLKALIVRDILGNDAFYRVINSDDPVIREAIRQIDDGSVYEIMFYNDPA